MGKHNFFFFRVTNDIKEVPQSITNQDLEGILAFFQVAAVQKLSQESGRLEECLLKGLPCILPDDAPSNAAYNGPPDMPGGLNTGVDDWQKLLDKLAGNKSAMDQYNYDG